MHIAVFGPGYFGGKEYTNYEHVAAVLNTVTDMLDISSVRTGGGKGVEQLALKWAAINNTEAHVTPPNMKGDKDNAFIVRNREIIDATDVVVLLWDAMDDKYAKMLKECAQRKQLVIMFGVE